MESNDPFFGTWLIDPARSAYQVGTPPRNAVYQLEPDGEQIKVTMDWDTEDGQHRHMVYNSIPDGQEYPYENPSIADFVSMTRVNAYQLDNAAKKDGKIISWATRQLSEDGQTMTITQSAYNADGQPFDNVSVYVKQS